MWPPVLYGAAPPGGAPGQMLHVDPALLGGGAGTYESSPVLKLKGLPFAATTEDIAAFFAGFALVSARVHLGLDGRPSGMVRTVVRTLLARAAAPYSCVHTRISLAVACIQAFCVFASPEEAARAMSRDRAYMGERFVKILRVPRSEVRRSSAAHATHLCHAHPFLQQASCPRQPCDFR
jgi:hypothetical protein